MTLSPAKDFKESTHGRTWQEVVGEAQFQEAAKAAMLECASEFSTATPAEAGWRLQGAQAFIRKLMSLAEAPAQRSHLKDTINLSP